MKRGTSGKDKFYIICENQIFVKKNNSFHGVTYKCQFSKCNSRILLSGDICRKKIDAHAHNHPDVCQSKIIKINTLGALKNRIDEISTESVN